MTERNYKPKFVQKLFGYLCFITFGICAFFNPLSANNNTNILFGVVVGFLFGWFFKVFLSLVLSIFNRKLKKENGKGVIKYAINIGILFLIPFSIMLVIAVFYLRWSVIGGFVSAGIMAVGTVSAIELAKIKGASSIKDTILTSIASFLFSLLWTVSYTYLAKAPGLIEGGIKLITGFLKGGASI